MPALMNAQQLQRSTSQRLPKKEEALAISNFSLDPLLDPILDLDLPSEIKAQIFIHLDIEDAGFLRLTSRAWAITGTERLFRDGFKLHPHCQPTDMDRLRKVSECPHLAQTIKSIVIYLDSSDARKILRRRIANETGSCDPVHLAKAFSNLPNFKSLTITSLSYPLSEEMFQSTSTWIPSWNWTIEEERTRFMADDLSQWYYTSNVAAINAAGVELLSVEFDCLPMDCLSSQELGSPPFIPLQPSLHRLCLLSECSGHPYRSLSGLVTPLEQLSIGFWDYGVTSWQDSLVAQRIIDLLISARRLRRLDLMFVMNLSTSMTPDFQIAWKTSFYSITIPRLESLRLHQTDIPGSLLISFLERHGSTLKNLHLSGGYECGPGSGWNHLTRSQWKEMLTSLRDNLSLQKFELLTYDDRKNIYDWNWNTVPGTDVTFAKLLENYVLRKGPWPFLMPLEKTEHDYWGWKVDAEVWGTS
ncbi:uncharacterized protein EAE97_008260 [Botrytis byssoidea]|uniref:F-box domain-containing protein n=1 Tax=Botrytis byssoidea TaxID=139641 RepID=A0A9P5IBJ1_9HELO|nr:uncharacterized protein EAE97_008260 [Botrytis byssoidea]KAF7935353.1 hypothetical protein EAE97_008260 [Botrytis byssoidea]